MVINKQILLGLFAKNRANRETMFMFSWSMTYVLHMGHYDVDTFTLVSSMGGVVLFTFDMYYIDNSNRVNSSLSFLLIKKNPLIYKSTSYHHN